MEVKREMECKLFCNSDGFSKESGKTVTKLVLISVLITASLALYYNQESYAFANSGETEAYTELIYSINVGTEKFLVHFNVCAGQDTIESPEVLLKSSLDTVQFQSTKAITANSCHSFESIIHAKYPSTIKIILI